jgi:hypothetical protein
MLFGDVDWDDLYNASSLADRRYKHLTSKELYCWVYIAFFHFPLEI